MSENASFRMILFLLVLCIGLLVYRDWQLQGEVDNLHGRVDTMDMRPVARILRAHTDEAAERAAMEEA